MVTRRFLTTTHSFDSAVKIYDWYKNVGITTILEYTIYAKTTITDRLDCIHVLLIISFFNLIDFSHTPCPVSL